MTWHAIFGRLDCKYSGRETKVTKLFSIEISEGARSKKHESSALPATKSLPSMLSM